MKRLIYAIILSGFLSVCNLYAATNDTVNSVVMASYEQEWLDREATISLKNNTDEQVRNVSFMLEYLDMNDNPTDYDTFSYDIEIAPGMTKSIDIPAFRNDRHYHYYKTKGNCGNPTFKVRYELKDYNYAEPPADSVTYDSDGDVAAGIIMLVLLVGPYLGLFVLAGVMAYKRHRNPALWVLLSLFITPLIGCVILLAAGESKH